MGRNRLPGINIPSKKITDALKEIIEDEGKHCRILHKNSVDKQYGTHKIKLRVDINDTEDAFRLELIKRKDGTVSINPYYNKEPEKITLGIKYTNLLQQKLDYNHSEKGHIKKNFPKSYYYKLIEYFDLDESLTRISDINDNNQQWENIDGSRLTITYYDSKHTFLAQFGATRIERIVREALSAVLGILSKEEWQKIRKDKEALKESLKPAMIEELTEELYNYISEYEMIETLFSSYQERTRLYNESMPDYRSVVQSICSCYEALMKTMFEQLGLPKYPLLSKYFYYNKKNGKYSLDRNISPLIFKDNRTLGNYYRNAFKSKNRYGRNESSHGGAPADHVVMKNSYEAAKRFDEIVLAMRESFYLLKPYLESSDAKSS